MEQKQLDQAWSVANLIQIWIKNHCPAEDPPPEQRVKLPCKEKFMAVLNTMIGLESSLAYSAWVVERKEVTSVHLTKLVILVLTLLLTIDTELDTIMANQYHALIAELEELVK